MSMAKSIMNQFSKHKDFEPKHAYFYAETLGKKGEVMAFIGQNTYPIYSFSDGSALEFKLDSNDEPVEVNEINLAAA